MRWSNCTKYWVNEHTSITIYIDSEADDNEPDDDNSTCRDNDMTFDLDSEGAQERVEELFSHASNTSRPCGVTPKRLSKVWHILLEDVRRIIDTTTQTSVQTQDPT